MPATASQVLSGMKTRLQTVSGLRAFDYQPDALNPPVAWSQLNSVTYHGAFGSGDVQYDLTVFVVVGRVSERVAQSNLDGYLSYDGASSIRNAIEGDTTLGGVAQTLVVNRSSSIRSLSVGEAEYLTIEISLTVHG